MKLKIDNLGRILIPKKIREKLKLYNEVYLEVGETKLTISSEEKAIDKLDEILNGVNQCLEMLDKKED